MFRLITGIFLVLHGLVHLWYFTLSQGLIEYQPEMGWTGKSWLFSNLFGNATTRSLSAGLYALATLLFVLGGTGLFLNTTWWRPLLLGAAGFSAALILLFWDGGWAMWVQKGLIGLVINLAVVIALLGFR